MDSLRRRKVHAEEGNLAEPLLDPDSPQDQPSTSYASQAAQKGASSTAVVPRSINKYDWEHLLQTLVAGCIQGWQTLVQTISSCFITFLPAWRRQELSLVQVERLQGLRERVQVAYDSSNPEHQAALRQLWEAAFPGAPCVSLRSTRWKEMGWQGEDPATDFRGGGLLALHNLLHLARRQPLLFKQLVAQCDGMRSPTAYPFAVAGVNLTFMLAELCELHARPGVPTPVDAPRGAAARGMAQLLAAHEDAFEQVYCAAFRVLDRQWRDMRATYMEFPQVMKRVREKMDSALSRQCVTCEQLAHLLLQ